MKILITGGAGFIGSNFVHYWKKHHPKDKIRVIDALTFAGNIENLGPLMKKIEFFEADITNRSKVKEAMKGIDMVVHFAAESHVDRSIFDPASFWKTNVYGTQVLLEEAKKAKVPRFHHISTDEVYGELPLDSKEKFNEKTPYAPRPDNLYAISKAEADKVVRQFAVQNPKMHITISNCSNNYGPYQFPEKFVPILVTNLIDGYKAPLHGDGLHVRDWIHTDDHASAVDLILQKGKKSETYLVGSDNDRANKFIAERVVDLYGKDEGWIRHVPDRHSNDRRYAIDATKVSEELGWKPAITRDNFDDGLKDTINWYRKNEDWWRPLLKRQAPISNGEKKIYAFMSLDRQLGRAKYTYKELEEEKRKEEEKLEERFIPEENVTRLRAVTKKLRQRGWFKKSSKKIQKELVSLAKDPRAFGFIEELAGRPDVVVKDKQLRLVKIEYTPRPQKYPIYGMAVWFEVENSRGEKRMEGFYSWGIGSKAGAKFLVLIRYKDKITHLALVKEEKFPFGEKIYGLAGGLPYLNESVVELISRKLDEDLGISAKNVNTKISEIIGLGRIMTDAGMTSNHPLLYAVVIDMADKTFPPPPARDEIKEQGNVVLWPVSRLSELINKVDDAYFLGALSRLSLGGAGNIKL